MKHLINGKWCTEKNSIIPIEWVWDTSVISVAENLRVRNFRILFKELHWERLNQACRVFMLPAYPKADFNGLCHDIVHKNQLKDGNIRIRLLGRFGAEELTVLGLVGNIETYPKNGFSSFNIHTAAFWPDSIAARAKNRNMLSSLLAQEEVNSWADDGLRLTPDGYLAEGCWSNIVIEKKGVFYTPPVYQGLLEGVTRRCFLDEKTKLGKQIVIQPLTRFDLYSADKIWILSSLQGPVRVNRIDFRQVGTSSVLPAL